MSLGQSSQSTDVCAQLLGADQVPPSFHSDSYELKFVQGYYQSLLANPPQITYGQLSASLLQSVSSSGNVGFSRLALPREVQIERRRIFWDLARFWMVKKSVLGLSSDDLNLAHVQLLEAAVMAVGAAGVNFEVFERSTGRIALRILPVGRHLWNSQVASLIEVQGNSRIQVIYDPYESVSRNAGSFHFTNQVMLLHEKDIGLFPAGGITFWHESMHAINRANVRNGKNLPFAGASVFSANPVSSTQSTANGQLFMAVSELYSEAQSHDEFIAYYREIFGSCGWLNREI